MKLFKITCIALSIQFSTITALFEFREAKHQGSLSLSFLTILQKTFNPDHFIETGTLTGGTTIRAAKTFPKIHTIELSNTFYRENLLKFKKYPHIFSHLGESEIILNKILPSIKNQSCMFYLDAHFSEGGTARGKENTPLLEEIKTIGSYLPSAIIIVDDIRLCQPKHKTEAQVAQDASYWKSILGYPSLTQLKAISLSINNNYEFAVFGDMLLMYPKNEYPHLTLSPIIHAMTTSRLFEELTESIEETTNVLKAEQDIIQAQGEEGLAIQQLLMGSEGRNTPPLLTTHYKLWNALLCIGHHQYKQAIDLLNEAYRCGLNHWRIQWYRAFAYYHAGDFNQAKALLQSIRNEVCAVHLEEASEILQELENKLIKK